MAEIVSTTPVVVFSKTTCPFCSTVKKLLTNLDTSFKVIELKLNAKGDP